MTERLASRQVFHSHCELRLTPFNIRGYVNEGVAPVLNTSICGRVVNITNRPLVTNTQKISAGRSLFTRLA